MLQMMRKLRVDFPKGKRFASRMMKEDSCSLDMPLPLASDELSLVFGKR